MRTLGSALAILLVLAWAPGCAMRIAAGATAIFPAGLVIGLVTGTEGTKLGVAIGEYNKMIDARMAEIKRTRGIT